MRVLVPPEEAARRARAAIAYAGLSDAEVAAATSLKSGTLRNIVSRTRPSGGTPERLEAIARACGVPPAFMELGWEAFPPSGDERLSELERQVTELRAGLVALSADSLQRTRVQQEQGGRDRPAGRQAGSA